MSRNINVNPAHYKVAGRERQGEAILQSEEKRAYVQERADFDRWRARREQAPGWENPAQPVADLPPAPPKKQQKRKKAAAKRKQTASRRPNRAQKKTKAKSTRATGARGRTRSTARPKSAARRRRAT